MGKYEGHRERGRCHDLLLRRGQHPGGSKEQDAGQTQETIATVLVNTFAGSMISVIKISLAVLGH